MKTKKKYPVQPERYKMRLARITEHFRSDSPMAKIAPILVMELRLLIESYYGGTWPMIRAIVSEWWYLAWRGWLRGIQIRFCDFVGWTKLYHYPETDKMHAMTMRHGKQCSGSPNCNDMNCIDRAIPRWFKWLTRWEDTPT